MHPKAVEDAKIRFRHAKGFLELMSSDKSFEFKNFEEAWIQFLGAINTIFSKLEQGSKINQKSKSWYDGVKHQRRKDPLLSYLRQARNSEEHTLEGSSDKTGFTAHTNRKDVKIVRSGKKDNHIEVVVPENVKKGDELFTIRGPGIYLIDVIDGRSGKLFQVPKEHLGQSIENTTPLEVASKALMYMENLISEAERLKT
ncbi:hypothetical protein [Sneathiella sp.]|uniref:hypothetical protein n=1 Tax=Sneathiella sp. TaxID=1964365 RepID=UPI002638655B|nr:hypothetical protein [Sneathiella sp.]MDF2368309.1 hypothetical protein [Sneathiella sp.]